MNRERYIRIPKDKKAMEDYDYGIQTPEQMVELVLSEEDYTFLEKVKVFDLINQQCDVIIDDYEEEILDIFKIQQAIDVVNNLLAKYNDNELLVKLKEYLEYELKYGTLVGFDF